MFDRTNYYRSQSGLTSFDWSEKLHIAAKAHANFCDINNITGHYEDKSKKLYFGKSPWNRMSNADYKYGYTEDIAFTGWDANDTESGNSEIDNLMTAIYHRKPLLSQDITEIGTGVNNSIGRAGVIDFGIAPKSNKVTIEYILFPGRNATNVEGYFWGESPDPLIDISASDSGNPISIFFKKDCDNISMNSFTLSDLNNSNNIEILKIMTGDNDPNNMFTSCDFAMFPKYEMKEGDTYEATFKYNSSKEIKWNFEIFKIPPPIGKELYINDNNQVFKIKNGENYYLNIFPMKKFDVSILDSYSTTGENGYGYAKINLYRITNSKYLTLSPTDNDIGNRVMIKLNQFKDDDNNTLQIHIEIVE